MSDIIQHQLPSQLQGPIVEWGKCVGDYRAACGRMAGLGTPISEADFKAASHACDTSWGVLAAAVCRWERTVSESMQERIDLDIDEFQRIKAELADLRVGIPQRDEDSARSLYGVVAGICDRAITAGRRRVPLIEQRDKAERERDAATSEVAKQRMRADSLLAALESLRDRCSQQRADWLKESRGASDKMLRASCAMAAGSFGTVLEWAEEAIAAGGAS